MKLIPNTWAKDKFAFGGALLKGSHAKKKRCFTAELPLHVVIRSSEARGEKSLFRFNSKIAKLLEHQSERHAVKLLAVSNAGNHLHFLIQAPARAQLVAFLRAITGRIAELANIKWDARPFSRIVSWGRDFKNVARYLSINSTEALGISRANVRHMFELIRAALREGRLAKSPELIAAGFV